MQGNRPKIEFDAEKHIYRVDGVRMPSVTEILEPITAKHYSSVNAEILRLAKERGTIIHEACEVIDYGFDAEVPAEYEGYVKAYLSFLRDYAPVYYGCEQMVWNREAGYCGTVDRWGEIYKKECVVDLKTTTTPTRLNILSGCCQTIAYSDALGISDEKRYLVYLKKNGSLRLIDCAAWEKKNGLNARKVWKLCLELYNEIGERNETER